MKDYSKDLMSMILEQKVNKFLDEFVYKVNFKNNDLTSFYITHKNIRKKKYVKNHSNSGNSIIGKRS